MKGAVSNSFELNLYLLKMVGLYPIEKFRHLQNIHSAIIFVAFTVCLPLLTAVYLLLADSYDMLIVADNAFMILETGVVIVKVVPFLWRASDVRVILHTLESAQFTKHTPGQHRIVVDCERTSKCITIFFLTMCWASLVSFAVRPFGTAERQLPLHVWLPFSTERTDLFYVAYIWMVLGVFNASSTDAAMDTLIVGLLCHSIGQIRILKDNLQHLDHEATIKIDGRTQLNNHLIYGRIKGNIKHYDLIAQFVKHVEDTFSSAVFGQFLTSTCVICFSCYELTIIEPFSTTFYAVVIFVITMLSQIYIYCYFGSVLHDESSSISTAIYMGNWYNYNIKSKKALTILMLRTKRPLIVTAGKVLNLSLITFTMILRRAYSIFAVLKNN